ncbi:MAG: hypothetical protein L0Y79_04070 [Chlorobi bacterium]|nr:hypothetical protein [Chlorobiota bacterium]MCI0717174.1 hypothetical protein [Chlorobiota bacterium]
MRESKLTEMLKGITPLEFKRFGELLGSPFHNKSRKILQLYDLISAHYSEFDANVIPNEKIAEEIFPGEKTKDQNVRTLISNFTALLEEFLILIKTDKSSTREKIILLESLRERNILKSFEMASKEISDLSKRDFNKNTEYYFNDLTHKEILLNYHGEDLDLDLDKSYLEMSESADYLFIVTKLKVLNALLSRKILSGVSIYKSYWGIDHIINYIENNIQKIEKFHPIIYSEYKILMMILKPDKVRHFHDLEKHVFQNLQKLSEDEIEQVYYSLANYCINKMALGDERFLNDLYKIHTNFEKIGFYEKNKNIQYTDFLSVIICGLNMKQIRWVNYFFDKYKSNIASEVKRDTINLASASMAFAAKKYKEAIGRINNVGYKYTYFYLKSRETLIKVYYELGEFESLEAAIDAAKHYLVRHKDVLSIHYDRFMLFLNYVKKLTRLDKKQKQEIKMLMKKLDENRHTISREWLIEKIIEMK